ncbi:glycoside hydrolase/phage tail family protein [Mesorhizobium sp. LHD-90]|uniref:baseplate multidomain protein megatron n=1 Tax=Mesorhizobium sp. LHD-90 TaxID=3071414 RepID=UPI0027E0FDC2|nr:glycoside hydrolase/phage tail family protein [Mesorhizobium sp. LHD-90]MDQ6436893.1 glycoside hydrolase/phage tail family protein [Mesorhizobium sp. LHD-90]
MAVLLLEAAGAYLGGLFGPIGSAVGTAAGAFAGYALDRALIDGTRRVEGPRLAGARPFSAEEGAPIPRLYGTARLGGTIIWATRFEETKTTRRQGGKGGAKVTEYSYFANVAFALCEGEIAGVRRVWADGRELDLNGIEMRVHKGGADQPPEPLIAARQGTDNTPAYRGIAYAVFERLPLSDYGNRIPQLQFEVLRPVGRLRHDIRGVALIPGSTEHGLDPTVVVKKARPGEEVAENRHVLFAPSDIVASLDELQMLCPNLTDVALVVSWFGDDLRAGECRIRPGVTAAAGADFSKPWIVSGIARSEALAVSSHGGGSAYGGTPTDASVMAAIAEIRSRGLRVALYPFIMMDIAEGNGLPDPHGGEEQAAYPWRGRISCFPGPEAPGSADETATARTQVEAFCGEAEVGEFSAGGGTVAFGGAEGDWGFRRLILHYAHLAQAAGGVDAFLIGSEMRGLTTLRDGINAFPFVEALCTLADEVKALLGPGTDICYGADWSEYFGHHPRDGSGDLFFHLDALWARPSISAVGVDNYMPLSDWRDADYRSGNPDGASGPYDPKTLRAAIDSGEGFDWFYASAADREARNRTPIEDGAYGKPWVFRTKDLVGWWSSQHFDRIGGIELPTPTAWTPRGKPIWLTELGCPAIDKGPNQPNVFVDPKSSESFTPYFSNGGRSDLAPKRFLEAHAAHWDPASPTFDPVKNPLSPVYGGRMLDHERIYVWCWDARPFPAFPLQGEVWADGSNWHFGHWLNGRLEAPDLGAVINAILADHGLPVADVADADGTLQGLVIDDPGSARAALEPLVDLFDLAVGEHPDGLVLRSARARAAAPLVIAEAVVEEGVANFERVRVPDHELPTEAVLAFRDHLAGYQSASARSFHAGAAGRLQRMVSFPGVLEQGQGAALVADWHRRLWAARENVVLSLASYSRGFEPGAIIRLPGEDGSEFLVTEIEDGLVRRLKAMRIERGAPVPWTSTPGPADAPPVIHAGKPHVLFLDLPARTTALPPQHHFRVAAWRKPWKSQVLLASPEETGFQPRATIDHPADLGELVEALPPGSVEGRVDRSSVLTVMLFDSEAAGVSRMQLLSGANAAAVRSQSGVWEIVQFETAEEIEPGVWRLGYLLRGQLGTGDAMAAGASAGAPFVFLDDRLKPAGLLAGEIGLSLNWKIGPSGAIVSDETFVSQSATGGLRARLPLAPVHLRCKPQASGDLAFTWVRRGRFDADDWAATEIPLGEEVEKYRIDISLPGEPVVRSQTVGVAAWTYPEAEIVVDFGGLPTEIEAAVCQLSLSAGWGTAATRRFNF